MIEVERVEQKEPMSIEDAITQLKYDKSMCLFDPLTGAEYFLNDHNRKSYKALDMAIKSLETIQRIDDVLNVEGMTEIDVLDEIMDAVSEFKYDCGVSE